MKLLYGMFLNGNAHLSLPGLSLTWKAPMTGRWSEVLMLEQLVYLTTLMSSACLLLNKIRSCEHKQRCSTPLCTTRHCIKLP